MLTAVLTGIVIIIVFVEFLKYRQTKVIYHTKTLEYAPTRSYFRSKLEMIWHILSGLSILQVMRDRVTRNEVPDLMVDHGVAGMVVVVSSLEGVKQVLLHKTTQKEPFNKETCIKQGAPYFHCNEMFGDSLIVQTEEKARKTRIHMRGAFKKKALEGQILPIMVEKINQMMEILHNNYKEGEIVSVSPIVISLTFDIIGKTSFGHDSNKLAGYSKDYENLSFCFDGLMNPLVFGFGQGSVKLQPAYQEKLKQARAYSFELIKDVIQQRRQIRDENNKDLLDLILQESAQNGGHFTDKELVHNIFFFISCRT